MLFSTFFNNPLLSKKGIQKDTEMPLFAAPGQFSLIMLNDSYPTKYSS